jgi:hypothetical protein
VLTCAAAVFTLEGCGGCKSDLQVAVTPGERALALGERFTPAVRFAGCGGTRTLRDAVTWRAEDTTVVHVDPQTGRTTAVRPGRTRVVPSGRRYGEAGVAVLVTVRASRRGCRQRACGLTWRCSRRRS